MNYANLVPPNAFSRVTLDGVVRFDNNAANNLTFIRGRPRPNKPHIVNNPLRPDDPFILPSPRARPPTQFPKPGDMELYLTLGRRLGFGGTAAVFEATVVPDKSSGELADLRLPPLVVKVSHPRKSKCLVKEAFYYDEMECLHGTVVPRCYGHFNAVIASGAVFAPWERNRRRSRFPAQFDETTSRNSNDSEEFGFYSDSEEEESDDEGNPLPKRISILILERLGGLIPIKEMDDNYDEIQEELKAMYSELAELGVDHNDIRYYNVLCAPSSLPSVPSSPPLLSPFKQCAYRWRLVDFDKARKTNLSPRGFFGYHRGRIHMLMRRIE